MGGTLRLQAEASFRGISFVLESGGQIEVLSGYFSEKLFDNSAIGFAFDACFVFENDAMLQYGNGDGCDIFEAGIDPTIHECSCFAGRGKSESSAWAGSVLDVVCCIAGTAMSCIDQPGDVRGNNIREVNFTNCCGNAGEFVASENFFDVWFDAHLAVFHDLFQGFDRVAMDFEFEKKAVELRLGQRVGSLKLDGVLRGEHEKGIGQLVGIAEDGDPAFLLPQAGQTEFWAKPG